MPDKNIFQRIIDRETAADIVYEDDLSLAFRDVKPQAPTHVLVIPKRPIASLFEINSGDEPLLGHLLNVASRLARQMRLDTGYRIVINCGPDAGQTVDHLHVHLLGGRGFTWPPG